MSLLNKNIKEREYVRVRIDDYEIVRSPGVIDSGNLAPCIAIAIHDQLRKIAAIGHFSRIVEDQDLVRSFLQDVITKLSPERSQVYLVGGEIDTTDPPDEVEEHKQCRIRAIDLLREFNFPVESISTLWNPDIFSVSSIKINTSNGSVHQSLISNFNQ